MGWGEVFSWTTKTDMSGIDSLLNPGWRVEDAEDYGEKTQKFMRSLDSQQLDLTQQELIKMKLEIGIPRTKKQISS